MTRRKAERRGRRAETLAVWWLRLRGYRILARRVRTPVGEIDLIVRRGRTLVFVEVKARPDTASAMGAITEAGKRRISRASNLLLARYGRDCEVARIDAVLIVPWNDLIEMSRTNGPFLAETQLGGMSPDDAYWCSGISKHLRNQQTQLAIAEHSHPAPAVEFDLLQNLERRGKRFNKNGRIIIYSIRD